MRIALLKRFDRRRHSLPIQFDLLCSSILLSHRKRVHSLRQFLRVRWHFKPSVRVLQSLTRVWEGKLQNPRLRTMLPYKIQHANFDLSRDSLSDDSHLEFLFTTNGLNLALVRSGDYSVPRALKDELPGVHQEGINASA
jgi:hypothetical protein